MEECRVCKIISVMLGKHIFLPILCSHNKKIYFKNIIEFTKNIDIKIVGGLKIRGYTNHDIDVIGKKSDIQEFQKRISENGIKNPIHYCGEADRHSHLKCAYYGIKLALTGKGY